LPTTGCVPEPQPAVTVTRAHCVNREPLSAFAVSLRYRPDIDCELAIGRLGLLTSPNILGGADSPKHFFSFSSSCNCCHLRGFRNTDSDYAMFPDSAFRVIIFRAQALGPRLDHLACDHVFRFGIVSCFWRKVHSNGVRVLIAACCLP